MPEIPWMESRVLSTHVYQDDTDRFEIAILEHPTRGTEVEYEVREEWTPLDTPSVLHHRPLYLGRSFQAAKDALDNERAFIVETKRRGGRLTMRPQGTRYDRPSHGTAPSCRCDLVPMNGGAK